MPPYASLARLAQAERAPDHPVAWRGSETIGWERFRAEVAAAARHVAGCRAAALICRDSHRFAVGLFGLLAAGVTVVLPPNARPGTLAGLAGSFDRLIGDDDLPAAGAELWTAPLAATSRIDFFTSGSTGSPKRIECPLARLDGEVAALERSWGAAVGAAAALATVPHHHIYGLAFKLLWPLAAGRRFAAVTHDLWEGLLAELPAGAVIVSSPAHLSRLGGLDPLPAGRTPALLLSAGAALPAAAAADALRVFGVLPTEIYGSTETGAVATRRQTSPEPPWQPLPGNQMAVTAEGRLSLKAPYVDPDHWVELADRAESTRDGGFHLRGRIDRVAKIEGKRIGLDEVERDLRALAEVAAAAVLVLDGDPAVLAAVVVPSAAGRARLDRLGRFRFSRHLRSALAATQEAAGRPRRWRFVEALPTDALGKHSAALLADLFAGADPHVQADPQPEPVPRPEPAPRLPGILAVRTEPGRAEIDLAVSPDLFWFQGHFPEAPILPGVVQLDWALEFARRYLGLATPAARSFQVKYKTAIVPGLRLTLALRRSADGRRLAWDYHCGDVVCSTGSIALETA
jgi:acyl-CoA synthetase (AMP-forming)/AMP-acid ligase II/3-hydroxymyristoyl/3-hydroxydecanoyl-(acyl carrier protein) dehydratase